MHSLEHLFPFGFGIDLAMNFRSAFLHDLHYAFIFACIEPEAVIVFGAGIQFEVVEAVLKFIQLIPRNAGRDNSFWFGNERASLCVRLCRR
jgi:hypothetical protein